MRGAVARAFDAPLRHDEKAWAMILERFSRRNLPMRESNRRQTLIPQGAEPIYNNYGTAPGFAIPACDGRPALIALPGPPREMKPLFEEQAVPWLRSAFPVAHCQRVLEIHTAGRSESDLNEVVADLFGARPDVNVAWLAGGGMVRVRLTLRAATAQALDALREEMRAEVVRRIGEEDVWGYDDETLPDTVGRLLAERGLTIAVAESCTGGLINAALTERAGASAYLKRGFVVYSNDAKVEMLGVNPATIEAHGAVSGETAAEMAAGALRAAGADIALAVTGIAGPSGGTAEKPVGLVFVGIATETGVETHSYRLGGERAMVRQYSTARALDLARRRILREWTAPHTR
ncbi:MAG: Nicotinamide-nucleotide amidohydrolase PncC [candidate division BRC1 bacterium ADurb.BinA364]|nr:MAG: Nicotinamide-nucleotide amidohydrolase PncC [candidate division BRC1 bacterium ADurb.BinA364]